jgi:hypothetical protein
MPLLQTVSMIDDYKCWRPYVRSSIAHCWNYIITSMIQIYINFPIVFIKTPVQSDQRCFSLIPECSWTSCLPVQTIFRILCTETRVSERLRFLSSHFLGFPIALFAKSFHFLSPGVTLVKSSRYYHCSNIAVFWLATSKKQVYSPIFPNS